MAKMFKLQTTGKVKNKVQFSLTQDMQSYCGKHPRTQGDGD
jgi:hypothetical protein